MLGRIADPGAASMLRGDHAEAQLHTCMNMPICFSTPPSRMTLSGCSGCSGCSRSLRNLVSG
jgi:hypothetical protein